MDRLMSSNVASINKVEQLEAMPMLDHGVDEEAFSVNGSATSRHSQPGRTVLRMLRPAVIVAVVVLCTLGVLHIAFGVASPAESESQAAVPEVISMVEPSRALRLPGCKVLKQGDHEWHPVSTKSKEEDSPDGEVKVETHAKKAVKQALLLAEGQRRNCDTKMPTLPWEAETFLQGAEHTHYVQVHHKFDSECQSETYKLNFFISSGATPTSFELQVNHDGGQWQSLTGDVCNIKVGSASAPVAMEHLDNNRAVQMAAKFAIRELTYMMKKHECLPEDAKAKGLHAPTVKTAIAKAVAGVKIHLLLEVSLGKDVKEASLTVFERCAGNNPCVKQLIIDKYDAKCDAGDCAEAVTLDKDKQIACAKCKVCSALLPRSEKRRRLFEEQSLGAHLDDPTELWVAQRQMLTAPRKLGQAAFHRAPLMQRYIRTGPISPDHDPREEECFQRITVYNQGSCGSCYAQAIAQMIGIRKCLLEKQEKGRRMAELEELPPPKDMHAHEAKAALLKSQEPVEPRELADTEATCEDSKVWSIFGRNEYNCAFFKDKDLGCKRYKDYGQRSHCKKACDTCPKAVSNEISPWHNALYQYMPAVNELAQCAKSGNKVQGCNGGNTAGVWNNWMRSLPESQSLSQMGANCMPYTLKCKHSSGVVNPLTGGSCEQYEQYELWHKPCSCIPSKDRPKPEDLTCPSANAKPKAGCGGVDIPPRMFIVKNVGHGLSIAETVKNMQRHIAEFGPIYVSFLTTNEFMHHNWKTYPVYTGGKTIEGGHAVTAIGWGTQEKDSKYVKDVPYWILRNSWGADWADKGYCKFMQGINLDGIEGRGISASMPTMVGVHDWSPPVCHMASWQRRWSFSGNTLQKYELTPTIICDKPCTVKVFGSVRIENRKVIEEGVQGYYRQGECKTKNGKVTGLQEFNLLNMRFKEKGDMWIQIQAEDGQGNKADSSSFIEILEPQKPK